MSRIKRCREQHVLCFCCCCCFVCVIQKDWITQIKLTKLLSQQLVLPNTLFQFIRRVRLGAARLKKFDAVRIGNADGCPQKMVGIKKSILKKVYLFIYFALYFLWIAKNNLAKLPRINFIGWIIFLWSFLFLSFCFLILLVYVADVFWKVMLFENSI